MLTIRVLRVACTSLFSLLALTTARASDASSQQYVKDASQFCFPRLSADEQVNIYSKILSIGASYSHGCIGCDQSQKLRSYTDLTNDQFWFRRNFLMHFMNQLNWKKADYGRNDKVAILENDAKTRPTALIPRWSLQRDGYTGEWIYDVNRDVAHLTDPAFSKWLSENTSYGEATALVGGPLKVTDLSKPRTDSRKGTIFQSFRSKGEQDPQAPRVIDLSIDGARVHDFFNAYVPEEIMIPLEKSKWTDSKLRRMAVQSAIQYIKSYNPTLVIAIDVLFWDSVSHAVAYMRESNPKSLIVKALLNLMAARDKNGSTFNELRRFNVAEDFYQVLKGISQSNANGPAIPVIVARLINNPLDAFSQKQYEPILGAVLGQYLSTMIGQNFSEHFAEWLRKMSSIGLTTRLQDDEQYFDSESQASYSSSELFALRNAFEEFQSIMSTATPQQEPNQKSIRMGGAKLNTNVAPPLAGIASWAILKALKDLPLFMQSLERAMQFENRGIRALTSLTDNNTHLINVDPFFENFPFFLKPETMHPSVFGAQQMAAMVNSAVCQSTGQQ